MSCVIHITHYISHITNCYSYYICYTLHIRRMYTVQCTCNMWCVYTGVQCTLHNLHIAHCTMYVHIAYYTYTLHILLSYYIVI